AGGGPEAGSSGNRLDLELRVGELWLRRPEAELHLPELLVRGRALLAEPDAGGRPFGLTAQLDSPVLHDGEVEVALPGPAIRARLEGLRLGDSLHFPGETFPVALLEGRLDLELEPRSEGARLSWVPAVVARLAPRRIGLLGPGGRPVEIRWPADSESAPDAAAWIRISAAPADVPEESAGNGLPSTWRVDAELASGQPAVTGLQPPAPLGPWLPFDLGLRGTATLPSAGPNGQAATGGGTAFEGVFHLAAPLAELELQGRASLKPIADPGAPAPGSPSFDTIELEGEWRAEVPRLAPVEAALRPALGSELPWHTASGRASGAGSVGGTWTTPRVDGRLEVRGLEGRIGALEAAAAGSGDDIPALRDGSLSTGFRYGPSRRLDLRQLRAEATAVLPTIGDYPLRAEAARLRAAPSPPGSEGLQVRVGGARIHLQGLAEARLEGDVGAPSDVLRIGLGGIDLDTWQQRLSPLLPASFAQWQLAGTVSGELEARLAEPAGETASGADPRPLRLTVDGPLRLDSGGFSSADGSRVAEGLAAEWSSHLLVEPDGHLALELEGRSQGFVLLWGVVFADLTSTGAGLGLRLNSDWKSPAGLTDARIWLQPDEGPGLRLSAGGLPGLGHLLAAGGSAAADARLDAVPWSLELDDPELESTHARYLAPLVGEGAAVRALGGRLHLALSGTLLPGGDSLAARGHLKLEGARVETADTRLEGVDLDLPLELRRHRSGDGTVRVEGPPLEGSLSLARAQLGPIRLPPIVSALEVEGDGLRLAQPVAVDLLGGRVILEKLGFRGLLGERLLDGAAAETGLRLEGLQMERLSESLGVLPLEGRLDGHLPRVRLEGQSMRVEGESTLRVFGGEVRVRDISGSEVLTPFPQLRLSAELLDLDLGQITRRFDFGEMTGLVRGSITSLALFRGVPTAFEARLETVEAEGVPRTVDVKAVQNITILGTGSGANLFDRGLQRFLKRYRYESLGVSVALADDVLLLRGLERRGERELFLKGRFPFGIDVVNARPGQTVSFQTMVERLKSIEPGSIRTD
ncbi:MAG: YdbH domain-containing protein, partial [Holophagales bacterium]|nr:YdbH domain-containing protein [Holophagales bacterium]